MTEYMDTFEQFWESLVTDEDGNLDRDKVARELSDYDTLLRSATRVYFHATGGVVSKPFTAPQEVIAAIEANYSGREEEYELTDDQLDRAAEILGPKRLPEDTRLIVQDVVDAIKEAVNE